MVYSDCKFGIEMEFTGVTRRAAANILGVFFGTGYREVGGTYHAFEACDTDGRRWQVMSDSSVHVNGGEQCELVSPVLGFSDMPLLMEVIRQLRHNGAKCNDSCGFHVHLSCPEQFNVSQLKRLIYIMHSKQNIIYEALGVISTRTSYCHKLPEELCQTIKSKKPQTMQSLADIWYSVLGGNYNRSSHYNNSRYHCLNLHNLFSGRQPTVEFRCANGSLRDARVVRATIELYALIVAYSFNAKNCSYKTTVPTGSHKYAMRVFMVKIGAVGDELAVCRKYILKNMSGDTAWRTRC